ncbi:MAG: hypothetical protein M3H12_07795 [Chromatiales bacterium]|nr:hypothetical protein [Gammaproteobacteria bacterium]
MFLGKQQQAREPRSRLIGRFVENWLNGVVMDQAAFADDVRAIYFAHHPDPDDRRIKFCSTGDAPHDLRENRQVVMRRLRGEVKFESDFEESVIDALPDAPRRELLRLLSARVGLLAAPIPDLSVGGGACDLGRLSIEFGEALEAVGHLMEDGRIDAGDCRKKLDKAAKEIDDLLAVAVSFRHAIETAIAGQS